MITADDFIKKGFLSSVNSVSELNSHWNFSGDPSNRPELPPISDEDKANLDLALRYLQQNPRAAEVLDMAITNGIGIGIVAINTR
ncbi:hypothetical protein ABFV80_002080 [Vandammella animalimorsus]|uniref:hypothetical protein n=1 Tax=Vandammella animalimorsus TaxID=2029117 RepID=UPI00325B29C3